jgi:hypothetical protein
MKEREVTCRRLIGCAFSTAFAIAFDGASPWLWRRSRPNRKRKPASRRKESRSFIAQGRHRIDCLTDREIGIQAGLPMRQDRTASHVIGKNKVSRGGADRENANRSAPFFSNHSFSYIDFSKPSQRSQPWSWAFLLATAISCAFFMFGSSPVSEIRASLAGSSPARMNPWPAPS